MNKKTVRWGTDTGFEKKVKSFEDRNELSVHGLKGKRAKGDLGLSRGMTRREARRDATDAIPVSEAMTQDQWSEREQLIAERAEEVRRGLTTWMSTTAAGVRNYIQDQTPSDIHPDQLREAIKAEEHEFRHYELDDTEDARTSHSAAIIELQSFRQAHGAQIGERTPDIKKNVEQAIAILMFVMLVEGAFNALLFKDAQASGLLGGLMIAFGVSAVNVLFGVTAGFFGLRYLNHPALPAKIMGGVVAGISILSGIFLNFFVAHYRDAVEERVERGCDVSVPPVVGGLSVHLPSNFTSDGIDGAGASAAGEMKGQSLGELHRRLARIDAVRTGRIGVDGCRGIEVERDRRVRARRERQLAAGELRRRGQGDRSSPDLEPGEQSRGCIRRKQRGVDPDAVGNQVVRGRRIDDRRQAGIEKALGEGNVEQNCGIGPARYIERNELRDPEEVEPDAASILAQEGAHCLFDRRAAGP